MVLIKSISGVRGIIHKDDSQGLSSVEIIKCTEQFSTWIIKKNKQKSSCITVVVGRDGRVSGERISDLIIQKLVSFGINVIDLGLTTTPSVQMAVISEQCLGGMMISASHNPRNWNGLKLLNLNGEFLSKKESLEVFTLKKLLKNLNHKHSTVVKLDYKQKHIESILDLVDVNVDRIKEKKFKIVVDGINSSGGLFVPYLLKQLGVHVIELNCTPNGEFAHNPEPLPEHLIQLSLSVKENKADLGIAVDPDVDRLVLVCEDGSFFGEEYTIVAIAKYILSNYAGSSIVSNLSTTKAVKDIATQLGAKHFESAVGEINVVELMKEKKSIIGGEGSGGVIFALSHYGRDALVGIALFLSYLSTINLSVKALKSFLPNYYMLKEKVLLKLDSVFNFEDFIKHQIKLCKNNNQHYLLIDGIKIYYSCGSWAHIRTSNTEPIVRLIIESEKQTAALGIKSTLINDINNFLQ